MIEHYSQWLQRTDIPKLLLYAVPGFITTLESVKWAKEHCQNLDLVSLDNVLHYAQESAPALFAAKLREWLITKNKECYPGCVRHSANPQPNPTHGAPR